MATENTAATATMIEVNEMIVVVTRDLVKIEFVMKDAEEIMTVTAGTEAKENMVGIEIEAIEVTEVIEEIEVTEVIEAIEWIEEIEKTETETGTESIGIENIDEAAQDLESMSSDRIKVITAKKLCA